MLSLTSKQQRVLEYIQNHINHQRMAPTLMEIGEAFQIANPNGVRVHLLALERKGYIERVADKARSIRVLKPAPGKISDAISSAKRKLWEKLGYVHHLPVYIALRTRKGYPFFTGGYAEELEKKVARVAADHHWEMLELKIFPDKLRLGVIITPDHSIERVVRNIKNATLAMAIRHPIHFHAKKIWATGFAASSDPWVLDELERRHAGVPEAEGEDA